MYAVKLTLDYLGFSLCADILFRREWCLLPLSWLRSGYST